MALIVQKFGGTSVGDVARIQNVARRVVRTHAAGNQVAVVVSAMAGETNALVALAKQIGGDHPDPREYDALTSIGESKTIALLAMAIHQLGHKARSFTGTQMGMLTDSGFTRARIQQIDTDKIRQLLNDRGIAVLAGFQGVDEGRWRARARAHPPPRTGAVRRPSRSASRDPAPWRARSP